MQGVGSHSNSRGSWALGAACDPASPIAPLPRGRAPCVPPARCCRGPADLDEKLERGMFECLGALQELWHSDQFLELRRGLRSRREELAAAQGEAYRAARLRLGCAAAVCGVQSWVVTWASWCLAGTGARRLALGLPASPPHACCSCCTSVHPAHCTSACPHATACAGCCSESSAVRCAPPTAWRAACWRTCCRSSGDRRWSRPRVSAECMVQAGTGMGSLEERRTAAQLCITERG